MLIASKDRLDESINHMLQNRISMGLLEEYSCVTLYNIFSKTPTFITISNFFHFHAHFLHEEPYKL